MLDQRPQPVDTRTLWNGGLATAAVAATAAAGGTAAARRLLSLPVLLLTPFGVRGYAPVGLFALVAAAAALAVTALAHVLVLLVPAPLVFVAWTAALVTALAALWPFATDAPAGAKWATATLDLLVGVCVGTLATGAGARAMADGSGIPSGIPPGMRPGPHPAPVDQRVRTAPPPGRGAPRRGGGSHRACGTRS
jgi:hypothetical protein